METIKNYLESMFQNLPKTEEVIKAKAELLSMMEDKYNELKSEGKTENEAIGTVIAEFGNLDELTNELGIKNNNQTGETKNSCRHITLEEAKEYLSLSKEYAQKVALGVLLCIYSPIMLILLSGIADNTENIISENVAGFIGLLMLFIFVSAAVGIFILSSEKIKKFEFLKKEEFEMPVSAESYIRNLYENGKPMLAKRITIGVILCILSVVPVLGAGMFFEEIELICIFSVIILLLIVGTGVFILIKAGTKSEAFKVLLREEEYGVKTEENKLIDTIASIYWPLVVAIYLGWSFISMKWELTWIIWPVAGVTFGAIAGICKAVVIKKE